MNNPRTSSFTTRRHLNPGANLWATAALLIATDITSLAQGQTAPSKQPTNAAPVTSGTTTSNATTVAPATAAPSTATSTMPNPATVPSSPAPPSPGASAAAPSVAMSANAQANTNAPADLTAAPVAAPGAPPVASPPSPTSGVSSQVSLVQSANSIAPCEPPSARSVWHRDGFYLRLMNGIGYMTLRGNGPNGSASISGLGSNSTILIGGAVSRGLVVAGMLQTSQVNHEYKGGPLHNAQGTVDGEAVDVTDHATGRLSAFGIFLDMYPMENNGLHLGLGAGLGMVGTVNQLDDAVQSGTAAAGTLMVGYDWPISRAWALGLALVASGSTTATMKHSKSGNESGYELHPFSIGLSTSVLYF